MKNLSRVRFLVGLFALLGLAAAPPAHALSLFFSPLAQTVLLGQQALVAVGIAGTAAGAPPSIGGYDVDVVFDDGILTVADVSFGTMLGHPLSITASDASVAGRVNLAEVSLLSPAQLDGSQPDTFLLAILTFDTLSIGTSPLRLSSILVSDGFGLPLAVLAGGGSITVTAVPEPATLPLSLGLLVVLALVRRQGRRPPHA